MGPKEIAGVQASYEEATKRARERRRAKFREAQRQGWSIGRIAAAAGISKTRVAQILRGE